MRLIDADKLCSYIADVQLSNAPDERDSEEVQKAMKEVYEMYEDFLEIVDEQPTVYNWNVGLPKEDGQYLCTVSSPITDCRLISCEELKDGEWISLLGGEKVVAYMELPKMYEGDVQCL